MIAATSRNRDARNQYARSIRHLVQQDAYVILVAVCDCKIGDAVSIEVRCSDRNRSGCSTASCEWGTGSGRERAATVAQHDSGRVVRLIRDSKVDFAVRIEVPCNNRHGPRPSSGACQRRKGAVAVSFEDVYPFFVVLYDCEVKLAVSVEVRNCDSSRACSPPGTERGPRCRRKCGAAAITPHDANRIV